MTKYEKLELQSNFQGSYNTLSVWLMGNFGNSGMHCFLLPRFNKYNKLRSIRQRINIEHNIVANAAIRQESFFIIFLEIT